MGTSHLGSAWQTRLLQEQEDLQNKIDDLQAFVLGSQFPALPEEDQALLREQLMHMHRYFAVLSIRTARHCH